MKQVKLKCTQSREIMGHVLEEIIVLLENPIFSDLKC